jgi:hypothetical protein
MRVDDRNLNGAAGPQPGRTQETQETGRPGPTSGAQVAESAGGDRTEISSLASRVSQALAAHSAERAQHIGKLANQYLADQYQVSLQSTSRAVIQDALERKDGTR